MSDRKVTLTVTHRVTVRVDEGVSMQDVLASLNFTTNDDRFNVEGEDLLDWDVEDSK